MKSSSHMLSHTLQYTDAIMGTIASQITSLTIVYSTIYSDADERKHQNSASLAFVRVIHRGPVNSPHKWPVTRKMFPFDNVIMGYYALADGAVFRQEGATPQAARIRQKVLNSAAIDVPLWPTKCPYINIIKNVWSVILRRINGMDQFPRNAFCVVDYPLASCMLVHLLEIEF